MTTSSFWSGSVRGGGRSVAQAASVAALLAADNLFDKVVAALERGDGQEARRLATRTADRPFDDHEGVWPGPAAAHHAIFMLVTDTVEEWPDDDDTWVDALAEVLSQVSGRQLGEIRHLAGVLHHDALLLGVHEREASRLRVLAGGADPLAMPSEVVPGVQRSDYVLELAHLYLTVQAQLERALTQAL